MTDAEGQPATSAGRELLEILRDAYAMLPESIAWHSATILRIETQAAESALDATYDTCDPEECAPAILAALAAQPGTRAEGGAG